LTRTHLADIEVDGAAVAAAVLAAAADVRLRRGHSDVPKGPE